MESLRMISPAGGYVDVAAARFKTGVEVSPQGRGEPTLILDGCEFLQHQGNGLYVNLTDNRDDLRVAITVDNSYFRQQGAYAIFAQGSSGALSLTIRNNTIVGSATGIGLWSSGRPGYNEGITLTGAVTNNVIMGSQTALDFHRTTPSVVSHNALFGNTTNYAGLAVPAPGTVTSDPKLDMAVPPTPGVGSPLVGAGTGTNAPVSDFWGRSRSGRSDIGAVQAP